MATSRDELREDLVAAIEAAPELPKGDREHLADVFLDRLTAEYDRVQRGTGRRPQSAKPLRTAVWNAPWVPFALALAFPIFAVPAAIHHFPIFLLAVLVVFLAVRRAKSRRSSTTASG